MATDPEKTPGRKALVAMEENKKFDLVFKKPEGVPKRGRNGRKQKILDEESYIEGMDKIIERDFFPDLEKVRTQTEYLDAVEKNDVMKLREIYAKYSGKRPPIERLPSPATFETPANLHSSQNSPPPSNIPAADNDDRISMKSTSRAPTISLDQYLAGHTSQDNESFGELVKEAERKHRERYSYLYKEEHINLEDREKQLALPSIEEQARGLEKKAIVDTWGYRDRNYIMFTPDGAPLTKEKELDLARNRLEVVHLNTRLTRNPFDEHRNKETISELAKTQAKILDGKIGVDGKEILKGDTPKVGGFSLLREPSPSPTMIGSPLMTWGEIEGTPFRLDGSDTPRPSSQGPSFKMAEPPVREQIAFALAEKVGEKNRDQKRKAMAAARKQFASPSPRPNTSTIDRLATMSPAARRLATTRLGIGSPYSPSVILRSPVTPKGSVTPKRTPKGSRTGTTTPKLQLGIRRPGTDDGLTDDLLKISLPKRCKAADFF